MNTLVCDIVTRWMRFRPKLRLAILGVCSPRETSKMCLSSKHHYDSAICQFEFLLEKIPKTGCLKANNCTFLTNAAQRSLPISVSTESEDVPTKGRIFKDHETVFHHSVLENSNLYLSTIYTTDPNFSEKFRLTKEEFKNVFNLSINNWDDKSAYSLFVDFVSLGVYISKEERKFTMDDSSFDKLISAFVDKCQSLNDDQVMDCLIAIQYWPQSDHVKADNFLKVWKALDNTCHERFSDWSLDKILYIMDLWYQIRLTRLSNFVFKGLNKISKKCEDLTQAQMIQTLLYMSCVRKLHPAISLREYEYHIQKHITHLSIEEIAIFALAFFKTKTPILNTKILMYMMQRVIEEIESVHQISLTAIVKALRYSHKPELGFTANDFVNKLAEKKMDSLNLINIIHILHISTQVQFYNQEAVTKLAEKFCSDPSVARLKDMERVLFILSLFNYIPPSTPDILEVIVKELDNPHHVQAGKDFPLTLLSLLYYLSLMRVYPEKQIHQLLDEEFLKKKYESRFIIPNQVVQIDYNRVLEGPPDSEHLLSPHLREYLARRYSLKIPDKSKPTKIHYDQMFIEVMELTKQILGGEEFILPTYILPHFPRPDILFRLDQNGKSVRIPEEMRCKPLWSDVVKAPDSDGWFAVLLGGRNMYMHNTPRLVGEQVTKLRQLRLLGYTPITIPFHYWRGEKNKLEYLKLKYFTRPK